MKGFYDLGDSLKKQIRNENLRTVLKAVFNLGITSRVGISEYLNLNKATVSSLYSELNECGYFIETGQGNSTSAGGRRRNLFRINPDYGYIMSFDFGFNYVDAMKNGFSGRILRKERINTEGLDIFKIIERIKDMIKFEKKADRSLNGLLGIGFSIHGIVNDNRIVDSPFMDFKGIDVAGIFENDFEVPVFLENEANLSAVYERDFGTESPQSLVAISIHRGVGAGVVYNGLLNRGANGRTGEIGRITDISLKSGKIEDFLSDDAVMKRVCAAVGRTVTRQDVVSMYEAGDMHVKRIFDDYVKNLSVLTYDVSQIYDPTVIYYDYPLFEEIPDIFEKLKKVCESLNLNVPVRRMTNSENAQLLGSFSIVLNNVLGFEEGSIKFKEDLANE